MTRHTALREALERHQPGTSEEAEHLRQMLALLATAGESAFARDHYEPGHFTASAFVLSPDGDALLLIHHQKLRRWLQPGGHVDPGDVDLVAAAQREVAEETGLSLCAPLDAPAPLDVDVHVIPALPARGERAAQPSHRHYDVRYLFRAESSHLRAGDDAEAARWVPFDAVSAHESDASVLRAVRRIVARGE